jgi:hypothetical protein
MLTYKKMTYLLFFCRTTKSQKHLRPIAEVKDLFDLKKYIPGFVGNSPIKGDGNKRPWTLEFYPFQTTAADQVLQFPWHPGKVLRP